MDQDTTAVAAAEKPSAHFEALRRFAGPVTGILLFAAALGVLRAELRSVSYREVAADLVSVPLPGLLLALALTALNYAVVTGYDQLAFIYIGRAMSRARIGMAAFVAYAIANNVGFAMLSGASVRYRFYTRWGLTPAELSRIVLFYSTTFWLGLLVLGGASLAATPPLSFEGGPREGLMRGLGAALLLLSAAYALLPRWRQAPVQFGGFSIPVPSGRLVSIQFALSLLDWTLAAAVLFPLLPESDLPLSTLLSAFLAAQILGLVSNVPGGLGVFESVMVVLLRPHLTASQVLPALVLYRVIYYLVPLVLALGVLVVDEIRQRQDQATRVRAIFGALAAEVTPRVLGIFTFLAGAVLLFSGATPAAEGRLDWLADTLPLPVIEASHFLGSIMGVVLLLVSQGIARRLDATWYLAVASVGTGLLASLLKGFDFEEASFLAALLFILVKARAHFDRKAAFFATRFSIGWIASVVAVLGASIWLGFFAFKHVEYTHSLWWQFEFDHEASRFLRATVGASMALLLFGIGRLLRPGPPEITLATDQDLEDAERVIATQTATSPYLVHLRDKALLFNDNRSAFIMYGVQGRTWVALGDPVGPPDAAPGLIREFLERCDDFDGEPVFYEVSKERLHLYADFGFAFAKLGEEARVDLSSFSLQGSANKEYRTALRRLEKEGGTFRVVPREEVPAILDALEDVSNQWMKSKAAAEKGFSLGFFDRPYVSRFPAGVIEVAGRIEAFATVWPGARNFELSVDLMRFRNSAPRNVMEALFLHLILWGQSNGYKWFSLGMAPLSGLDNSPVASLWTKAGAFVYRKGEGFYNFQGLRAYKAKFQPVWEPRYLTYPGGLALPRIVADVAALIAGGYRRIFRK
ncbi:MAG: bifunctional lysylphosphatidylglycerol flippase/synthetase MprF [Vicinamibacteria bacterium]|nr:bifunctional lysylphosphatidylglycerol flippase/synthetase MprF [Vicinamibacteria bacterium]